MIHILYGGLTIAAGIGMFFLPKENSWIAAIGFIVIGAIIFGYGRREKAETKAEKDSTPDGRKRAAEKEQKSTGRSAPLTDLFQFSGMSLSFLPEQPSGCLSPRPDNVI